MRVRFILRADRHRVRLVRFTWDVGNVGDGKGYSRKLSVALNPRLFRFVSTFDDWRLILFGIEVHSVRAWGGRFAP